MSLVHKLEVRLTHTPDEFELVGHMVQHERTIYFEYDPAYLATGRSISPLKLPLQPGITAAPRSTGLHGVFADALPDGWGMLLMDRYFVSIGRVPGQLSPLDRLAYLGPRTMGALTFHPCTNDAPPTSEALPLHRLAAAADEVLEGSASELLPVLRRAGGSSGGARPKVLVALRSAACSPATTPELLYGVDPAPLGYSAWLIKFFGRSDDRHAGAIEYVYSQLARHAGLEVPEARLFVAQPGQRFFGVRRFDRYELTRSHLHSLAGLLDADFRLPSLDYDHLLRVTARLTGSQIELRRVFRQMLFNVLTHNRDDHGKNFSFIMERDGSWRLSPAYDLTFAEGPGGEHTMTIRGEGRRPTWAHMQALAKRASIDDPTARRILDEVRDAIHRWPDEARAVDLPDPTIHALAQRLAAVEAATELPGAAPPPRRPAKRRAPE